MVTAYEQMISGQPYRGSDPELLALQAQGQARLAALNAIPAEDRAARHAAMRDLFGSMGGPCIVMPPFSVEFGCNIHLGSWVYVNMGATFMDAAPITIGDRVAIGPNVQFITPTHPVRPEDRFVEGDPDAMPPFAV